MYAYTYLRALYLKDCAFCQRKVLHVHTYCMYKCVYVMASLRFSFASSFALCATRQLLESSITFLASSSVRPQREAQHPALDSKLPAFSLELHPYLLTYILMYGYMCTYTPPSTSTAIARRGVPSSSSLSRSSCECLRCQLNPSDFCAEDCSLFALSYVLCTDYCCFSCCI